MTTHDLISQTPAALVGVAVLAAPIVQLLKVSIPQLRGWKALAANFGVCAIGALATHPDAGQVATLPFWVGILEATVGAAGVHGIGKGLGLFGGVFSLPENLKDPLQWQCPHVENDAEGRPVWMCPAGPGEQCVYRDIAGKAFPAVQPHAERIALVTGGGPQMSEATAAAAADAAEVAPLFAPSSTYTGSAIAPRTALSNQVVHGYKGTAQPKGAMLARLREEEERAINAVHAMRHHPTLGVQTPAPPAASLAAGSYPGQENTLAKLGFIGTVFHAVEGFAVEIFKDSLNSDEGKKLEDAVENFIKTDVGEIALDAVSYASTLPTGTSNADLRAAAKAKLVADLKTAGKDVVAIGDSGIELFISLAYTGATAKIASLSTLLEKVKALPVTK